VRAQITFVGPEQINFIVPTEAGFGSTNMNVMVSGRAVKTTVNVQPVAPAIFTMIQGGREMGAILNAVTFKGNPFSAETPQIPGCDTRTRLAIYATGLGLATHRAKSRDVRVELQDASGSTLAADVEAAVPAPGYTGLEQVNIVLPSGLRAGTVLLRIVVNGVASNRVQIDLAASEAAARNGACLGGVTVSRASEQGGAPFQGTVSLAYPAASGGVAVSLSADDGVSVPGSVVVPAGEMSAVFPVMVSGAAAAQAFKVNASLNGSARTAPFEQAPACVRGIAFSSEGVVSGMGAKGAVMLTDPAPGEGVSVDLITNNPSVQIAQSVAVPGGQMSAGFDISTALSVNPSKAIITAAGGCGGTTGVLNVVLTPCISAVSLSASALKGGGKLTGTVRLNAPAMAGGLIVNLMSSDPSLQVDTQVRVEEGQTSATFTLNASAVVLKTTAMVTGTVGNCGSAVAAVTLMP
jgi:uncharacterized protein (TIGR03437 family)